MDELRDKVAFITGGASGIGLGMATAFLRAGMKVAIGDLRQEHLQDALRSFEGNASICGIQVDVTDRQGIARAADEVERTFGNVHVVCNNAGVAMAGPIKLATYDDWDWILSVNLGGVINGVQTFLPRLLAHREGGHIVNTATIGAVMRQQPGLGLYATTKHAIVGLSEALRVELAEEGVGVSVLCPGPVNSRIAECGKNRPQDFSETGFAETDKPRQAFSNSPLFMDPVVVGELVLQAIRRDEPYIFTHSEFREDIHARCEAILAAIPARAPNLELLKMVRQMSAPPSSRAAKTKQS